MIRIVVALALLGLSFPGLAAPLACSDADVTSDCAVNVQDAVMVTLCWQGAQSLPGCDADRDGDVDVFDAQAVVAAAVDPVCSAIDACVVCVSQPSATLSYLKAGWWFGLQAVQDGEALVRLKHDGHAAKSLVSWLLTGEWLHTTWAGTPPVWLLVESAECTAGVCTASLCASVTPDILPY